MRLHSPVCWIFSFVGCLLLAPTGSAWADDAPRYNVLLIVSDDLNADVNCYGQPIVATPNIDRLAARGVRFDRAYCQYALCNPSRSSFLSGYGPDRTGVIEQDIHARKALPDAVYLPQMFRNHGYYAAARGKLHHGGRNTDVDSWDLYNDDEGTHELENSIRNQRKGREDRTPSWMPLPGDEATTQDGMHTRSMEQLIEERAASSEPFFLALGLHKPHVEWTAPARFFALYPPEEMPLRELLIGAGVPQIALQTEWPIGTRPKTPQAAVGGYFACVSFVDHNVGRMLAVLNRLELWESTIVVFMSDHGFHLGDHGLWSKKTLFEQSLHVPLMIALPDGRNAGRTCQRTVQLLDIYPTLADLCGLTPPSDLEGHSLRPLLENPDAAWEHPAYSQVMHEGVEGRSVRTERWRYTEWDGGREGIELYDHDLDPLELRNFAEQSELAAKRAELAALLDANRPGAP